MGLTDDQKLAVLGLHFKGVKKYTEISRILGLPYASVNSYLTKWKNDKGLLNKRKPRKKLALAPEPLTIDEAQELKLLRNFYERFKNRAS